MIICDKSSCNHCEKIFDSKNKLYDYIRNHKCVITSFFAAKSISFHKFNLSTLASVESIIFKITITSVFLSSTSLLTYRFVSFSPFTYKLYKKSYLTIADLYIRYVSLNRPSFNKVTRIMTMLFVMFMQDLYEKFYDKKKRVILTLSKTLDSPIKQYTIR